MAERQARRVCLTLPLEYAVGGSRTRRLGQPKAVNVDCGDYFAHLDPDSATFTGTFDHSWHIGNRVFARDLAMVIEGEGDRWAIPTRQLKNDELVLRDASMPTFESKWYKTNPIN